MPFPQEIPPQSSDSPLSCSRCSSDTLHPYDADKRQNGLWEVSLRCGNCLVSKVVLYTGREFEAMDNTIDDATTEIAKDLARLIRIRVNGELQASSRLASDYSGTEDPS